VWSVSWRPTDSNQLLMGLGKGKAALADLRMSGHRAVIAMTSSSSSSGDVGGDRALPGAVLGSQQQQQQQWPCLQGPVMPWHSLVPVDPLWPDVQLMADTARPDALLACTGDAGWPVLDCAGLTLHPAGD
jgi:hypothetical protein